MTSAGGNVAQRGYLRTVLSLDAMRTAGNEEARPLPYLAGKQKLPANWISPAFGISSVNVPSQGKGKLSGGTAQKTYYASIAAAFCIGPVDRVFAVIANNSLIWMEDPNTPIRRNGDSVLLTLVSDYGQMELHWGTETQGPSALLDRWDAGGTHPPYRGVCYAVFSRLKFGVETSSAPNIEVILGRWPEAPWAHGGQVEFDMNPTGVMYDIWTHPRCLNLESEILDAEVFGALAARLVAPGQNGISPVISQVKSARETFVLFLEYLDGWFGWRDGKLGSLPSSRTAGRRRLTRHGYRLRTCQSSIRTGRNAGWIWPILRRPELFGHRIYPDLGLRA